MRQNTPSKTCSQKAGTKKFQKSLKTNQPTNQPTNPLLTRTVREEQQQHQRGQHN
jgi:hypothetical protein